MGYIKLMVNVTIYSIHGSYGIINYNDKQEDKMGYPIFRQSQLEKNGWKIHERDDDHFLHKGSDICNPTPKTSTY